MTASKLLDSLDRVRRTGPGRWQARCPAHDDRGPSLSIRELDDGRILLHCFAGCSVHEVLTAAGLEISDLFPDKQEQMAHPERRPFPAADALRAVAFEAVVVAAAGTALLAGEPFSPTDRERLILAVSRLQSAVSAVAPQLRRAAHG